MPLIGIIGFLHQSNTFLPEKTTREHFAADLLLQGEAIRNEFEGSRHEIAGFFAGLAEAGYEAVPMFVARAQPHGVIAAQDFESLLSDMILSLETASPIDGLLVAAHGAMVAENAPDADGTWLQRLRVLVGPACPIIGTLDLQANLSQMMVESCTALIGPRISSHFDQHDSGLEAARLLGRTLRGEVCPVMAASFPPLAIATPRQAVRSESLAEVFALAQEQRVYPLVLSNSVFLGFPQADVREMGASAIVVTEGDDTIAENFADDLALALWESRESWQAVSAEIPETPLTYHHRRQPMFPWEPTAEWGIRK